MNLRYNLSQSYYENECIDVKIAGKSEWVDITEIKIDQVESSEKKILLRGMGGIFAACFFAHFGVTKSGDILKKQYDRYRGKR